MDRALFQVEPVHPSISKLLSDSLGLVVTQEVPYATCSLRLP